MGVKTEAFVRPDRKPVEVPDSSRYAGIRDFIVGIGDGRLQNGAIPASRYAEKVVGEVEGGAVGTVWAGTHAFMGRVMFWLAPRAVFVSELNARSDETMLTRVGYDCSEYRADWEGDGEGWVEEGLRLVCGSSVEMFSYFVRIGALEGLIFRVALPVLLNVSFGKHQRIWPRRRTC
jgi:hypothetical protein